MFKSSNGNAASYDSASHAAQSGEQLVIRE
jgi:hypothetical protein